MAPKQVDYPWTKLQQEVNSVAMKSHRIETGHFGYNFMQNSFLIKSHYFRFGRNAQLGLRYK